MQDEPNRFHAPAHPYSETAERLLREAGRRFRRVEAASADAADQMAQGADWTTMRRADFDRRAPVALIEAASVARPVPATPDAYGTAPLFGSEVPARPAAPRRRAHTDEIQADTLFDV
ncbi:hypothetical protein OG413_20565 [Streptomyces sp. NBC_01433]|uniref:hypothetical protein n=1 Tax=Streptomyces sp. NBC_01433 TaxID=2903864 RepID=UPI0022522009|nr:hypothetical protein [Streptomyces sp. NBC_01433]MCX4677668.1 hypothetical protein [Streptomyces sp. NBC_01433]